MGTFGVSRAVSAVVHISSVGQAVEQSSIAFDSGVDGVFLIWHGKRWGRLADACAAVRAGTSGWVGANALDLDAVTVFEQFNSHCDVDGIWTDNAHIDESVSEQRDATLVDAARATQRSLYFGGVAFKYQRRVVDLEAAAAAAVGHMDVLCTSGAGTGSAPTVEHVRRLAAGGPLPVAVASGVDAGNVAALAGVGAKAFLVGTSIESDFGVFDADRIRDLVAAVRAAD